MLNRTLDATRFNAVANHPEVLPWLGAPEGGPLDLSGLVGNPANVSMLGEHGGFIGQNHGLGRYEVHSLFEPAGRGPELVEATAEGLRYLFTATDCLEVVTKVPANNRPAAGLARAAGFQPMFERQACWPVADGPAVDVSYQSVTFDRWCARDAEVLAAGHWFHETLEAAKSAAGSALPAHDNDEAHDRAVGAAVLMLRAGNPQKAVAFYNRWAVFAGYAPVTLVSVQPPIIDLLDAVVEVRGDQMEVLSCR